MFKCCTSFSLKFLPFFAFAPTMEGAVSLQMTTLLKRLDEAERRSKLLSMEVKRIRSQIQELRNNISSSSAQSTDTTDNESAPKRVKPNESEKTIVYVDGACENNGKSNAKAGIGVWFGPNDPKNISKPVIGRATNNTAEIQACCAALETCISNGIRKVHIKTDSEFTIKCMTQWIQNWKKKNWKKADGRPVINKEDLEVLDRLCSQVEIQWEHVRGHMGITGNEEADKLARMGAEKYTT